MGYSGDFAKADDEFDPLFVPACLLSMAASFQQGFSRRSSNCASHLTSALESVIGRVSAQVAGTKVLGSNTEAPLEMHSEISPR